MSLFRKLYEENTTNPSAPLYDRIESVYATRNLHAHTAVRDPIWDDSADSANRLDDLRKRTLEAEAVDNLLLNMMVDFAECSMPPALGDDYAGLAFL